MEQQSSGKISSIEAIFMLLIVIAADLFEMFVAAMVAVPIIGWALIAANVFVSLFVWLIIQFWLIMKGVPGWWFVAGGALDVIPLLSSLPCKTAAMARIVIKYSDLAEDVLKVVSKVPLPQAKAAQAALRAAKTAGKIAGKV